MFNGIVETLGEIQSIQTKNDCQQLVIKPQKPFLDIAVNDSVSLNGVCLTITDLNREMFTVTAVPETLRLTNLIHLSKNYFVNLERSLLASSRIGGHWVQGHVDGMGKLKSIEHEGDAWLVTIEVPTHLTKYIVNKGYIALDGMSITVIKAENDWITATFIPHTRENTIVQYYQVGQTINIEVDVLAKYLEKLRGHA